VVSRDGSEVVDVTAGLGDADVISVVSIDDVSGYVYFMAAPGTPLERYLYRAALAGGGVVERVTPNGVAAVGTHSYQIAPNGARYAVHSFSSFNAPGDVAMVSLPKHETLQVLSVNDELRAKLAALAAGPVEFFEVSRGL
jgi:dipeptidyl-peptidase-4